MKWLVVDVGQRALARVARHAEVVARHVRAPVHQHVPLYAVYAVVTVVQIVATSRVHAVADALQIPDRLVPIALVAAKQQILVEHVLINAVGNVDMDAEHHAHIHVAKAVIMVVAPDANKIARLVVKKRAVQNVPGIV